MKLRISWRCEPAPWGYCMVASTKVRGREHAMTVAIAVSKREVEDARFLLHVFEGASRAAEHALSDRISSLPTLH